MKTTTPLNLTLPTSLATLYRATQAERSRLSLPPLPTPSTLLREALTATLLAAGIPPEALPPPPSPTRTTSATLARSRARLERSEPSPEECPACRGVGGCPGHGTF